ncbi:DUF3592 domain-containing protein [Paramicrobacterium fandaimingii]|uniref:DUF3592 domain-containing protein n=1 Tax=Paramicrobacterium fandaimingii TaxID=2708079 RepID=UPI00141F193F|nr:DUF3592 domain-containing protein [Microbacterium fandaimingii]
MGLGIALLCIGILIFAVSGAFLTHSLRKQSRWKKAKATITKTFVRKPSSDPSTHMNVGVYTFADDAGSTHSGEETDGFRMPKRGSVLTVMYDPASPSTSEPALSLRRPSSWLTFVLIPVVGLALIAGGILVMLFS